MAKRKTHEEFINEMNIKNPNIEILGTYITAKTKILCRCKIDGYEWETEPTHLLRGQGCPKCGGSLKKTHKEFVEEMSHINSDIEILGTYINAKTKILCRCKIDGHEWYGYPTNLLRGARCPLCTKETCVEGVNDVATTHPHLVKYFKNPEDATNYSAKSNKKMKLKCPICDREKIMPMYSFSDYGFKCDFCNDNISFPNKFIRLFLEQLPVTNVKYEYSPTWANNYRYDSYFEYMGKKYIVEMDGGFHYKDNELSKQTYEESRRIDNLKDNLATDNGIEIIRVDCRKSTLNYIKNSILNCKISKLFSLDNIDWEKCTEIYLKEDLERVCKFYNNSEKQTAIYVSEQLGIYRHKVEKLLRIGTRLGLCDYNRDKSMKQLKNRTAKPIIVLHNDKEYHFDSTKDCCRRFKDVFGVEIANTTLRKHCKNGKPFKDFIFKYVA